MKLADIARRKQEQCQEQQVAPSAGHYRRRGRDGADDEGDCDDDVSSSSRNEGGVGDGSKALRFSFEEQKTSAGGGSLSAREGHRCPMGGNDDDNSAATWSGNVFDRLYRDYKKYEHRNLEWEPPQLPVKYCCSCVLCYNQGWNELTYTLFP